VNVLIGSDVNRCHPALRGEGGGPIEKKKEQNTALNGRGVLKGDEANGLQYKDCRGNGGDDSPKIRNGEAQLKAIDREKKKKKIGSGGKRYQGTVTIYKKGQEKRKCAEKDDFFDQKWRGTLITESQLFLF